MKSPTRSAAEVENELRPMPIPALLEPSRFLKQKERNLRWNDIRYEFLLSFLDVTEWYDRNRHHIDELHAKATTFSKARLCGLLHICYMAWEGGAKEPYNHGTGDTYLKFWFKSAPTEAKDNIRHALKFSQGVLQEHKVEFVQLCVYWFRDFDAGLTMKEEDRLHECYCCAFKDMHKFVCFPSQISSLSEAN